MKAELIMLFVDLLFVFCVFVCVFTDASIHRRYSALMLYSSLVPGVSLLTSLLTSCFKVITHLLCHCHDSTLTHIYWLMILNYSPYQFVTNELPIHSHELILILFSRLSSYSPALIHPLTHPWISHLIHWQCILDYQTHSTATPRLLLHRYSSLTLYCHE